MSQEEDDSSKTHDASEAKIRKAREKGDVPTSKEVGHFFIYMGLLLSAIYIIPVNAPSFAVSLGQVFEFAPRIIVGSGTSGVADIQANVFAVIYDALEFLLQFLILMFILAGVSGFLQGPFVVSQERITPKLNKISPLKGVTKIFGAQNLVEFTKNTIKLVVFSAVSLLVVYNSIQAIMPAGEVEPTAITSVMTAELTKILIIVTCLMIPIAAADIFWKRFSFMKKQKMTAKEVKDEHKDSEGDPQVKYQRALLRRRMKRTNLQAEVPKATMILTNPTHFAVALRYNAPHDKAPVCIAKGADLLAHKIREIAHANGIPVIENRPLARALYATVEVDEQIPEAHWQAVAEIIKYIHSIRAKIRAKMPDGSSLRSD